MPKTWRYIPHDASRVRELTRQLNISPLLGVVLAARGYHDPTQATAFLNPRLTDLHDPDTLPGVSEAADRIVAAVKAGRRVVLYGDYDVDGVTSLSLLWHCLQLTGARVEYYVPHRLEEGYGLNCEALRSLHEQDPASLVVTVDCGITSVQEAALARELGLELIVTDHHTFGPELPNCSGLVHPRLPDTSYPFGDLCGVGVAFKLAWAIGKRLGDGKQSSPQMRQFLLGAMALAAIGTIADVVPLKDENRLIVRHGLKSLRELSTPGLKALLAVAGLQAKETFNAEDVAFNLAPRINAAGRMGQARLAVELLTTSDAERAAKLADYLEEQNKMRQTVERKILKQARELVAENPGWNDHRALVLAHHDWHAGVIGIVASRVAEAFEKPAVLIALNRQDQSGQGSARSFAGFDLHAGLTACAEHLTTFGGHRAAAGLRIAESRIDAFRDDFCRYVEGNHEVRPRDLELTVDAEVRLADLTAKAIHELDKLGPFGQGNRRPLFASSQIELVEPPKKMGGGERHLSLLVRQHGKPMRAVAFGRAEWADEIAAHRGKLALCYEPHINSFRGRDNVELQLIDWQPDSQSSSAAPLAATTASS